MKKMQIRAGVLALVAGVALATAVAAPAEAASQTCALGASAIVGTYSSSGSVTSGGNNSCGQVKARAVYRAYPGSPTYYSSWAYGSTYVKAAPGGTTISGQHSVTNPAPWYAQFFPFTG